jgi:hypothetical protein
MSLAIAHFAVGGTLTTLVLLYVLPPTRYARSLVVVGGLWGMVPDVHWVSPVFVTELRVLHHSAFANVFWLHRTLDVVDTGESKLFAAVAVAGFVATSVLADRWAYATREQAAEPSDSALGLFRSVSALARAVGIVAVVVGGVLFALAVVSPGVRRLFGLYVGLGTALVVGGSVAAASDVEIPLRYGNRVPETAMFATRTVLAVGAATVGLGLLLSPLRSGTNAASVAYAALGGFVGLQTLVFARAWSAIDGDGSDRSDGGGDDDER